MADVFKFPDVGEGLHEGEIVRWLIKVGDSVKRNQPLVEMETAKAIVEIPSPQDGIVSILHGKEGDIIKVGSALVTFGAPGESVSAVNPASTASSVSAPATSVSSPLASKVQTVPVSASVAIGEIRATPHTRRLAQEMGVDLRTIKGTGNNGRITDEDVRSAAQSSATTSHHGALHTGTPKIANAANISSGFSSVPSITPVAITLHGPVEKIPLRGLRKTIAETMHRSVMTAAHVTHFDEADVTELWELRKKELANAQQAGVKLTFLPFFMKAVVIALKHHPYLNSTLDDAAQEILLKKYYNIGVAVDTPEGLIVPVVKDADKKSILELANEIQHLSELARTRKLPLESLQGGTFTITNIGSVGGKGATPIINHPEVAILATFSIEQKPVVHEKAIVLRYMLPLALSFDHRVLDGAMAARFVKDIIRHLEDPAFLLLEMS